MAPRSPISASVADWFANVRGFFAYLKAEPPIVDEVIRTQSMYYAPLAGTLVRIQARYGTLNARIQREADRLALWLLAKVDLPEGISDLLVEGLSSEGRNAHAAGFVPVFKSRPGAGFPGAAELNTRGAALVFEDEAADNASYDSVHIVPPRAPRTWAFQRPS